MSIFGDFFVWEYIVYSLKLEKSFKGHEKKVFSLGWSSQYQLLASGSADSTVKIWNIEKEACLATLRGHSGSVLNVVWSRDGRRLASGAEDATIKIWDGIMGDHLEKLAGHQNSVYSIAWDKRKNVLASASDDGTVKFWHGTSGLCKKTLIANEELWGVYSIAFNKEGNRLAIGGSD